MFISTSNMNDKWINSRGVRKRITPKVVVGYSRTNCCRTYAKKKESTLSHSADCSEELEKIEFLNNLKYTWSGHHNLQLHIKKDKQIKNQSFILSKRLKKSLQEKKKKWLSQLRCHQWVQHVQLSVPALHYPNMKTYSKSLLIKTTKQFLDIIYRERETCWHEGKRWHRNCEFAWRFCQ